MKFPIPIKKNFRGDVGVLFLTVFFMSPQSVNSFGVLYTFLYVGVSTSLLRLILTLVYGKVLMVLLSLSFKSIVHKYDYIPLLLKAGEDHPCFDCDRETFFQS